MRRGTVQLAITLRSIATPYPVGTTFFLSSMLRDSVSHCSDAVTAMCHRFYQWRVLIGSPTLSPRPSRYDGLNLAFT